MTVVKVCGITRDDDARMVAASGVDWIGINFWPRSKRFVDLDTGAAVARAARQARPDIVVVGVFVNQTNEYIARVAELVGLDYVQLHGDESADDCAAIAVPVIKALAMAAETDVARVGSYGCGHYLIDTPTAGYGGSGRTFDWNLAQKAVDRGYPVLLAGGINPDNAAEAVRRVSPFGIDVASGVESAPGIKDASLVRALVLAVGKAQ